MFGISGDSSGKILITDNLEARITRNIFIKVVSDFRITDNFYVNLQLEHEENPTTIVTPSVIHSFKNLVLYFINVLFINFQLLKEYLKNDCGAQYLFDEEDERGISKPSRSKLMGFCCTLARKLHGSYPNQEQKRTMAECIRINFPSLTYIATGSYASVIICL